MLGTTVVLGVVPREELVKSAAPFADAARIMWGSAGPRDIVGVAVMVSSLGALNGWTLMMGQVPMALRRIDLFPRSSVACRRVACRRSASSSPRFWRRP